MAEMLLTEKERKFIDERFFLIEVKDGETREIIGQTVQFFDIHSTKAKQFGFAMTLKDGRKIACCGDEPYCDAEYEYVKGSTLMLHEAFCLYSQRDIFEPYKKNHSTVKDACELAEKLGVPNLVLYHTEDKSIENRKALYTEEGGQYYHGNLIVPGRSGNTGTLRDAKRRKQDGFRRFCGQMRKSHFTEDGAFLTAI